VPPVEIRPTVELPPAIPFTFQVTRPSLVPVTVAVNWADCRTFTVADVGETWTATVLGAVIVTAAEPLAVGVATEVACTATVAGEGTIDGAV